MTLQEILQSLDELSIAEQASLFNALRWRLEKANQQEAQERGERFGQGILDFRAAIEREGIEFTDEDFANLRDRSPGREVEL